MIHYKVPPREIIRVELPEEGQFFTMKNPSTGDVKRYSDAMTDSEKEKTAQDVMYDYLLSLGDGTERPPTKEAINSMEFDKLLDMLNFINSPKKK